MRLFAWKKRNDAANRVFVAAFGKHPGWDDHIEDIGLETEHLIGVKRLVYIEGISGNVDSGAWDKLSETQRLNGFDHFFVWRKAAGLVVGRMWSSTDGKGRTRYPMVVCAHCSRLPLAWIVQQVFPRLEETRTRCVGTTSASAVRSIINDAGRELRELAEHVETSSEDPGVSPGTLAELADRPEMGVDHAGLLRIIYKIEQGMSADGISSSDTTTRLVPGNFHIRVPACADSPADAIVFWLSFLLAELSNSNSVILLLPLGESWIDIVVGEPTTKQFYCIRASLEAIPLTTDIPYSLDREFIDRVERRIAASSVEKKATLSASPDSSPQRTR